MPDGLAFINRLDLYFSCGYIDDFMREHQSKHGQKTFVPSTLRANQLTECVRSVSAKPRKIRLNSAGRELICKQTRPLFTAPLQFSVLSRITQRD